MQWSINALRNELDVDASDRRQRILIGGSPYASFDAEADPTPCEEELIRASSLLALHPHLINKSFAAEIAFDEFCYFVNQTYFFEVLGFQVLSSMALSANSFEFLHEIGAQVIDEARHIEVYKSVISRFKYKSSVAKCIPDIFQKITSSPSLPEKAVKGFLVLESLAVGLFGSRIQFFPSSSLTVADRQILIEEVTHQSHALNAVSSFVSEGMITLDEVLDLMHAGVKELAFEIMPFEVAERHSLGLDRSEAA